MWLIFRSDTDHVFTALHEFLVDNFAGIVLACLDVDCFFDDGIGSAAESSASSVLSERRRVRVGPGGKFVMMHEDAPSMGRLLEASGTRCAGRKMQETG